MDHVPPDQAKEILEYVRFLGKLAAFAINDQKQQFTSSICTSDRKILKQRTLNIWNVWVQHKKGFLRDLLRPSFKTVFVGQGTPVNEEASNLLIRQWEPARWSEAEIKVWGAMDSKVMERATAKQVENEGWVTVRENTQRDELPEKNWMAMNQRQSKRGVEAWSSTAALKAPLLKRTSNLLNVGLLWTSRGSKWKLQSATDRSVPNSWELFALPSLVTRGS